MGQFDLAIAKFDEFNSADPNQEELEDGKVPRELIYARRMSACLDQFSPKASEEVRLAARCQHIGRWRIPRNTYPDGRKGYLQWRSKLKDLHAETASGILRTCGYDESTIEKVRSLLLKKDMLHNPDTQLLEDVACLVFLKYYLSEFVVKHEPKKVVDILKKTMKKMSATARAEALRIPLKDPARSLFNEALAG